MGPEVPMGACVGVCMWVCVCVCVFQFKKPGHYSVTKLQPLKILGQEDIGEVWRYGGKD